MLKVCISLTLPSRDEDGYAWVGWRPIAQGEVILVDRPIVGDNICFEEADVSLTVDRIDHTIGKDGPSIWASCKLYPGMKADPRKVRAFLSKHKWKRGG